MKMHILTHITAAVMLELLDEGWRRKNLNTEPMVKSSSIFQINSLDGRGSELKSSKVLVNRIWNLDGQ